MFHFSLSFARNYKSDISEKPEPVETALLTKSPSPKAADRILLDAKTRSLTLKFNDFGASPPSPVA